MQQIRAPNGEIIQFPDDMSDDDIVAVMKREFGKETAPASVPKAETPYSGSILPFSKDASGNVSFDSNAGILGSVKRAFSLPGEVYRGEVETFAADPQTGAMRTSSVLDARAQEAAAAIGTPITPASKLALSRKAAVPPPTEKQLLKAGGQGLNEVRSMGVDYKPEAVANWAQVTRAALDNEGYDELAAPRTYKLLADLSNPPEGSIVQISGLMRARKRLQQAAGNYSNPDEQRAANVAIAALGRFIFKPNEASVMAGPAAAAGTRYAEANANYAAGKRSGNIRGGAADAELQAIVANSGLNQDNKFRQIAAWYLSERHPERRRGFSTEEVSALREVADGSKSRKALRYVGNLLGGGGGLGAAITGMGGAAGGAGFAMGGLEPLSAAVVGLGAPTAGLVARKMANRITASKLQDADELVRMRSPLYERMLAEAPMEAPDAVKRAAINRALLLMHLQQQENGY